MVGSGYATGSIAFNGANVGTYNAPNWTTTFTVPSSSPTGPFTVTAGTASSSFTVTAPQPPPTGSIVVRVDPNDHSQAQVVSMPSGTAKVHIAQMQDLNATGIQYLDKPAPTSLPWDYKPPADRPVVDMLAETSGNAAIGGWAGRIATTPSGGGGTPPPPTSLVRGMDAGLRFNCCGYMARLQAFHADWSREDYSSASNWNGWYPAINSAGVHVLPVIYPGQDWASFLSAHPEINTVELVNEPEWNGESPSQYASEVVSMGQQVHAIRPGMTTLCTIETANPWQSWDSQVVSAAGAASYSQACDAYSAHLYTDDATVDPNTAGPANGSAFSFDRVDVMRSQMRNLVGVDKPVWVTEMGWSLFNQAHGGPSVSDSQRATYYQHFISQMGGRSWMVALFPFQQQSSYNNSSDWQTGFGLVNSTTGADTAAAATVRDFYASLP